MKRIIYIGDYSGQTIYFDTKKKVILKTGSVPFLSSEKTKSSPKLIMLIVLGWALLQPILRTLLIKFDIIENNVGFIPFLVIFGYFTVAIGLSWLVYFTLYGNSEYLELASKQEFRRAVANNNFGQFMGVKTSTKQFVWIKIKTSFVMIVVVMVFTISLIVPFTVFTHKMSATDAIAGIMAGMGPAVLSIIWYTNNLFRWLLIVEQFAKNKIEWGSEALEYEKQLKDKRKEVKHGK